MVTVTKKSEIMIHGEAVTFECGKDHMILDVALENGIQLPHNCRGGACGACVARIISGEVREGWVKGLALTEEDRECGKILPCISYPVSDEIVIGFEEGKVFHDAGVVTPLRFRGRILSSTLVAESVRRIVIGLPDDVDVRVSPGMNVEFDLPGISPNRQYSIASIVDENNIAEGRQLEFFISRYDAGAASCYIHDNLFVGVEVDLYGPFGSFVLIDQGEEEVICLAGGTGIAPILSIVRSVLQNGYKKNITIIFSIRGREDIFVFDVLSALSKKYANVRTVMTLTRDEEAATDLGIRAGRIPDILDDYVSNPFKTAALIAGSPDFVKACHLAVLGTGIVGGRIVLDTFAQTIKDNDVDTKITPMEL